MKLALSPRTGVSPYKLFSQRLLFRMLTSAHLPNMLLRNLPRHHMPYLVFLLALSTTISAFRPPKSQQSAYHHNVQMSQFDEAAYESNRLTQDAIAMDTMKRRAENEYEKLRTPWKWRIRKAVWDYLEAENIAVFPR